VDTDHPCLNIVLVEDHDILRGMLKQALEEAGHHVTALSCAEELEDVAGGLPADIFLIDLNLPGEDGFSLTERVRAAYPLAGLIVVTARSALQDKLEGYARGADMYLTKPLEIPELCATVAAIGRRRQRFEHVTVAQQQHMFTLSQQQMTVAKSGLLSVKLTAGETSMLVAFSRAPGQRVAYWQIAETLGLDLQNYPKSSLEVRIVRLRKKLVEAGADASCIESIRSHGYQLCIPIQVV
jgi:two-component system OmpR family response regulator